MLGIYDYLLLWNREYTYIWRRQITLVTVLYVGIRYVEIVDMFVQVFLNADSLTVKPSYLSSGEICLLLLQEARDRPFHSCSIYPWIISFKVMNNSDFALQILFRFLVAGNGIIYHLLIWYGDNKYSGFNCLRIWGISSNSLVLTVLVGALSIFDPAVNMVRIVVSFCNVLLTSST